MQEIAEALITIHGQHENQTLLQKKKRRETLDGYAGKKANIFPCSFPGTLSGHTVCQISRFFDFTAVYHSRETLDGYAGKKAAEYKKKVDECYQEYRKLAKELEADGSDIQAREREAALLRFEVKEIEEAALRAGEDEELEQDYWITNTPSSSGKKSIAFSFSSCFLSNWKTNA